MVGKVFGQITACRHNEIATLVFVLIDRKVCKVLDREIVARYKHRRLQCGPCSNSKVPFALDSKIGKVITPVLKFSTDNC